MDLCRAVLAASGSQPTPHAVADKASSYPYVVALVGRQGHPAPTGDLARHLHRRLFEELPLPAPPLRPRNYSLLILDIAADNHGGAQGLDGVVARLRRELVMPVFCRPDDSIPSAGILAFRHATAAAGAELLPPHDSTKERAHDVLTIRPYLASDWLRWYGLHREFSPRQEEVLRALINNDGKHRRVENILLGAKIITRSARRWPADASLSPPGAWARASRLLRALLDLQRDPELDIYDVAIASGYESAETFTNAMFRYFGHDARNGRGKLGLERRFLEFHRRADRLRP